MYYISRRSVSKCPRRAEHFSRQPQSALHGKAACASFDFSAPLTETVLLGNIAVRFPNETLKWNSEALRFTNNEQATSFVQTEYRSGWEMEGL